MHSDEQAARRPAAEHDVGRELCDDIDRTLDRRVAPPGTFRARAEHESWTNFLSCASMSILWMTPFACE